MCGSDATVADNLGGKRAQKGLALVGRLVELLEALAMTLWRERQKQRGVRSRPQRTQIDEPQVRARHGATVGGRAPQGVSGSQFV